MFIACIRVDFQCGVIFTCVKFTFANRIEAMHERSVNVETFSTSRLSSALYLLILTIAQFVIIICDHFSPYFIKAEERLRAVLVFAGEN